MSRPASDAATLPDRRVHAECATFDVVRYERAGKWYVESEGSNGLIREHVGVVQAAHRAVAAEVLGGEINYGLPGGSIFDRWVAKVQVMGGRL